MLCIIADTPATPLACGYGHFRVLQPSWLTSLVTPHMPTEHAGGGAHSNSQIHRNTHMGAVAWAVRVKKQPSQDVLHGDAVRMGRALGLKLLTFAISAMLGYATSQPPAISIYSLCPHTFPHCRKSFLFSYTKTLSFLIFLLHTSLHCPQPCAFLPHGCWHHPDLRC